ncbi:Ankyrin repeat domain-containing protein 13C [Mortierella alpina]|uniref:Ankyrin repeat domain-containing protein 13C n=1 Tax=Mortierella alpina TaxID=64518 RepID=A0A9P6JD29_MORAP|nr:Ankyrin repeat domain-containing protein 13C [Mortierella alpina]
MSTAAVDPQDPWALHKLVFLNKAHTLKMLVAPYKDAHHGHQPKDTHHHEDTTLPSDSNAHTQAASPAAGVAGAHHPAINTLDHHLHAPLHLAVMLGRKEMVSILLKAGANPLVRSGSGWTARQEATSLGDREMIELITRYQRKEFSGSFKTKAMKLVKQLSEDLDQFYFQLQCGLCPNDTYHIWKKGNAVRMDTSLVGFENMKWLRGHISIIFRVDPDSGPELVIIDRVKKITQRLARSSDEDEKTHHEPTEEEIEDEVSICFNSNITSTNVPTSAIKFQRAKAGMWGYRSNKVEKVGEYECAVWKMDGVEFRTRVRTEHLKDEFGKPIESFKRKPPGRGRGRGGHHHHHMGLGERGNGNAKRHGRGMQPRRPVHQPLFAPFSSEPEEEPSTLPKDTGSDPVGGLVGGAIAIEDGDQYRAPSAAAVGSEKRQSGEGSEKRQSGEGTPHGGVVVKKHARSTGTISDDAFFETALEEAEADMDEQLDELMVYRDSLPPPPPTTMTFEEYFDASKPGELHLGRPLEQKESRKTFGATLWMYDNNNPQHSNSSTSSLLHENKSGLSIASSSGASHQDGGNRAQFPLTIEKILPLLEVVGMDNNRLVGKLKEFLEFKLPPGFPIRANIPVYPSLSADVTFVNYDANRVIEDDMFDVPGEAEGYMEGFVIRPGGEDDT